MGVFGRQSDALNGKETAKKKDSERHKRAKSGVRRKRQGQVLDLLGRELISLVENMV